MMVMRAGDVVLIAAAWPLMSDPAERTIGMKVLLMSARSKAVSIGRPNIRMGKCGIR